MDRVRGIIAEQANAAINDGREAKAKWVSESETRFAIVAFARQFLGFDKYFRGGDFRVS